MWAGESSVLSSHIQRYVHETQLINLDLICDDDDDEEEEEETFVAWKLKYSHFVCTSDILFIYSTTLL